MANNFLAPPPPLDHSSNESDVDSHRAELPGYEARPDQSYTHLPTECGEYAVTMSDHHGKTWWTLRIPSRSPNSRSPTIFVEGDPIVGTVEANLQKPDHIKAIVVLVRGVIVYSAYDSKTFAEIARTIWPSRMNDLHGHSLTPTQSGELPPGSYSWSFSLMLPPEIQLSEQEASDYGLSFGGKLPPSLSDKQGHANIDYQVSLRIRRSGLFHHDSKLTTSFGYVPATRPDAPSRLRALAYEENLPVMGPDVDPEGWKIFPEIHLDGTLFKAVSACLSISLALPTPLSYPRGTAFPCAIILTSSNKQAVHLLSAPSAPIVEMHRKLQTAVGESIVGGALAFAEDDRLPLTKANWHAAEVHEARGVYTCTVLGELSLPPDLIPSFTLGKFQCEYVVDVYAPEAAGFEPASSDCLFRTVVTVTSLRAPGPRPRAYLPPGYAAPDAPASEKTAYRLLR